MKNIQPLDDRVVIETQDADEKTAGGIVLPDSAKEKPQRGKIVAAGPGPLDDDGNRLGLAVVKGDTVVFGKYAGTDVVVGGKTYKIMRERDILAKIKN
ncbi:MAG: co-chaperone GroES [Planctomycetes bacterium]|nr:co-chaperone GroES [Planctomycetota bacterium]